MNNEKPKRGHGYIYKYTSPSGKNYIGQTVQKISDRAGHNGKNYIGCKCFWNAIQKYGWQNFSVEILGEFPIDELNYQERKYIEIYNSLIPNGYNIQFRDTNYYNGGKTIYQYDYHTGILIRSWESQCSAADVLKLNKQSLNSCLNGRSKSCGGFYWSFQLLEIYPIEQILDNSKKEIYMCDLNNNIIKTFDSFAAAATFIHGERGPIRKCCKGELKTAYGYKWSCPTGIQNLKKSNIPVPIEQLDKDSLEVIRTFSSISEASREMGLNGTSAIRRVLDKMNYSTCGYRWRRSQGSTTKCS